MDQMTYSVAMLPLELWTITLEKHIYSRSSNILISFNVLCYNIDGML